MKGKLIIGVGTLGCKVVVATKRMLKGQRVAGMHFVGIDTQTDEPALQAAIADLQELAEDYRDLERMMNAPLPGKREFNS